MWPKLVIIPVIGALIGWLTNYIAIKLIFRPFVPKRIPFTPWSIQGLIPKRQDEIAVNVGRVVEHELISMEEIIGELNNHSRKQHLIKVVSDLLKERVNHRLPGFVPYSLRSLVITLVEDTVKKEAPILFEQLTESISQDILKEVKVEHLVEEKLRNFDMLQLERLIFSVASKELKHIEVLGAILGFLIGMVQLGVFYYWG